MAFIPPSYRRARTTYVGDGGNTNLVNVQVNAKYISILDAVGTSNYRYYLTPTTVGELSGIDNALAVVTGNLIDMGNVTGLGSLNAVNTNLRNYVVYAYG